MAADARPDWKRFTKLTLSTLAETNGVFLGTTFVAIGLGPGESTDRLLTNWALFCGVVAFVCFLTSTILALTSLVVGLLRRESAVNGKTVKTEQSTAILAALLTALGLIWLLASTVLIVQARIGPAFSTGSGLSTATVFVALAPVVVICVCGIYLGIFVGKRMMQ
jgi:uncharacterized protein (DUF697 family)